MILGKDLEVVMSAVTRTSVEEVRLEDGDVVIKWSVGLVALLKPPPWPDVVPKWQVRWAKSAIFPRTLPSRQV